MDGEWTPAIADLASLVRQSSCAVAFTGAGLSTESGIPDFRSPSGLWTKNKPIPFDAFVADRAVRNEAWRRKFVMDESFRNALPGRGHRVLAAMAAAGHLTGIITQNIDNLHQDSGVGDQHLVELHGNGSYATCLECRHRYELDWVRARYEAAGNVAPDCSACGGPVKSATISFGQAMPEAEMRRALDWSLTSDLFLAIGSSLVVHPAAGLPVAARRNGAKLVIINREPTPLDEIADLVISADIGDVLSRLADSLDLPLRH
ncbi:NAD-dependent deacetylase [Phreatobacter aquaticus]|uniref:protein acetyllysine N-acetyltransferase n=1 Tax=Phreatobacter aquaticus TaxID=2570229 RepID=A0A4D7QQN2_9HYPH|nr:Sir2 family NAD-dependent protein deacetylase [Phreatobacter aquaticus]QCK87207.1 NAD-dependent deacetylase [Phreatobacter aquaticus]